MATPTIEARVDAATRRAIDEFREESGFDTQSQAIRVLIGLGLKATESGALPDTFRRLAMREAYVSVAREVHKALGEVRTQLTEVVEGAEEGR